LIATGRQLTACSGDLAAAREHARGVMHEVAGKLTVAVVGGIGLYAGASGVIERRRLLAGKS
jgi:hypothetical protein